MEFTAKSVAEFLKGEIQGNPDVKVNNVCSIEEGKEGGLTFLSNPKYEHFLYGTKASIVLVNKNFVPKEEVQATLVKVDDAYRAFASLLEMYQAAITQKSGIDQMASIHDSAEVGKDCYVGEFSVIADNAKVGNNTKIYPQVYVGDNVTIGDNCIIYPGVKIYYACQIGNNCIIHSGVVIGSDGFGFAPTDHGYEKIPQIGNVIIEDDVEIGANTCLDRSTMGSTIIHKGAKLDNLIQIAHNVEIGSDTVMAAQCGVAGSSKIGERCMFGGQVGIIGHLNIGNEIKIGAQSGLTNSGYEPGSNLFGMPAIDLRAYLKSYAVFKQLPDLNNKIAELEKEIMQLKDKK